MRIQNQIVLEELVSDDTIVELDCNTPQQSIVMLVDTLYEAGKISDKHGVIEAILQRERIVATCVGSKIAVPHARIDSIEEFCIAIGWQKCSKGIHWKAPDNMPVHLVFLIVGPSDQEASYLELLSQIARFIRYTNLPEELSHIGNISDLVKLFHT